MDVVAGGMTAGIDVNSSIRQYENFRQNPGEQVNAGVHFYQTQKDDMPRSVELKNIEQEYQAAVRQLAGAGSGLSPEGAITLSRKLYDEIKVKGISGGKNPDDDMLLFQYGTYDWGDEMGEHFSFDITRQFSKRDDMYQLSLTLIFDPAPFAGLDSYNSWHIEFNSVEEWIAGIQSTSGYQLAQSQIPGTYKVHFTKV